ncbi:unnamed protein product, partial [Laminaria digitata]
KIASRPGAGASAMSNDDWNGSVAMHKALKALATSTRPISASRVKTAASTALDNVKEYKRVVHAIERFIRKAPAHHRIGAGCFVIDSVCRQAQSKWGHKDVFTPRFALRMTTETVETLRHVPDKDKPSVYRVIREWHEKGMFRGLESFAATGAAGATAAALGSTSSHSHHHHSARGAAVSSSPAAAVAAVAPHLANHQGVVHLGLDQGDTYGNAYPTHASNGDVGGGLPGVDLGAVSSYAPSYGRIGSPGANDGGGGWGGGAGGGDGLDEPLSDS